MPFSPCASTRRKWAATGPRSARTAPRSARVVGADLRARRRSRSSVRSALYPRRMANSPSRIDLLELDIDLRLADLWREAGEISEWSVDVVAAFMRAA